jgi:hypothetical protein
MRHRPESWAWALGLIALCAFLLRLYAINFGLPGLYDPDELMFELGAIRMLSHATLNPGWFGHPATTTMYGLALVNVSVFGVGHLAGWYPTLKSFGEAVYSNPGVIVLPGRVLMALFGAGTVWQTGKLAQELLTAVPDWSLRRWLRSARFVSPGLRWCVRTSWAVSSCCWRCVRCCVWSVGPTGGPMWPRRAGWGPPSPPNGRWGWLPSVWGPWCCGRRGLICGLARRF